MNNCRKSNNYDVSSGIMLIRWLASKRRLSQIEKCCRQLEVKSIMNFWTKFLVTMA